MYCSYLCEVMHVVSSLQKQNVPRTSIRLFISFVCICTDLCRRWPPAQDFFPFKVYLLVVMAGGYPYDDIPKCNMNGGCSNLHNSQVSSEASYHVSENWPPESKILWSGFEVGIKVLTGGPDFQQCAVATLENPVVVAMIEYMGGPNIGRCSWDPLTTLIAVRGVAAGGCAECLDCDGRNSVDPKDGSNHWIFGEQSNQTYLVLKDIQAAEDAINTLLCQVPLFGTTSAPPCKGK